MKALAYSQAHALADFAIREMEVPRPTLRPHDVLVEVRAISTNPVDYKKRATLSGSGGRPVILGWDAAGVVVEVGPEARGFSKGDEVYGAGDITRDGSYAELLAIDSRLIAKKPRTLSFAQAAALPLTSLTAWEGLLESGLAARAGSVLVIGGAGGVGSIATQLLKKKTDARVLVTASRPETIAWCKDMGADDVLDHRQDLAAELKRVGVPEVDLAFCTLKPDAYMKTLGTIVRPFGAVCTIDNRPVVDVMPLMDKSISLHWELMYTKSLFGYRMETQGEILSRVAEMVDAGELRTTANLTREGFSAEHIRFAHEQAESGRAIGKIVIAF